MTWVITVAGAGRGWWWAGPLALLVFAGIAFRLTPWPRTDLALVCVACLAGLIIDSAYVQAGLMRFAEPVPFMGLAPIWILGMWISFALTLNHSLGFFKRHLWLAVVFGAVGGPMAYWVAAHKFAAVDLCGTPAAVYLTLAVVWGVMTPLLLAMASNWLPRLDPVRPASR